MTDNGSGEEKAATWFDDAEEALEKVGESLRAAWEETREPRMSALEAAKEAAEQLGDAIDQAVDVVRQRMQSGDTAGGDDDRPGDDLMVDEE